MNMQCELEEIQEAMRQTKDRRMFERNGTRPFILFLSGCKRYEIAQILDRHVETVGIYIATYQKNGLSGLTIGHSSGKTAKVLKRNLPSAKSHGGFGEMVKRIGD
ncbi:helix-turn-helix domain-containing protein [Alkalicoccus saliphilus]|uniref:helix-turn-helix domain-containing protein n=1 Tax=Alkalicoccus saliphilus TaxID=200989 RepID=UPI0011B27312|nr:helix-turn-helix domain-containing protein [Alkalicoccus saliphilus]